MPSKKLTSIFIIILFCFFSLWRNIFSLPWHWDESYPIGTWLRYRNAINNMSFSQQDWSVGPEDHLPMSVYFIGTALTLSGWHNYFNEFFVDISKDMAFNMKNPGFATVLLIGRTLSVIYASLALITLYLVMQRYFSNIASLIVILLIGTTLLYKHISSRMFIEPLLGLFLILSLFSLVKWTDGNKGKHNIFWLITTGLFCACCYLTKINGIIAIISSLICITVLFLVKKITLRILIVSNILLITIFISIVTLLFPPFWHNPLNLHVDLFLWRMKITNTYQQQTPYYTLFEKDKYRGLNFNGGIDWGGEIRGHEALPMIFYRNLWYFDPIRLQYCLPMFGFIFICALIRFFYDSAKQNLLNFNNRNLLLCTWIYCVFYSSLFMLKLDVARHYYLFLFPVAFILAYGIDALFILLSKTWKHIQK